MHFNMDGNFTTATEREANQKLSVITVQFYRISATKTGSIMQREI